MAGIPSERARMATWLVAPPVRVQKPSTLLGSSAAVSDGARSSAIRMEPAGTSSSLA
jgi:hypothetical protein